jgi:hypothetical protein
MKHLASLTILILGGPSFGLLAGAQDLNELYRITNASFGTQLAWRQVKIAKGREATLAGLDGPGKVTYWYITDDSDGKWYPGLVLKVFWDDKEPSIWRHFEVAIPSVDHVGSIRPQRGDSDHSVLLHDIL